MQLCNAWSGDFARSTKEVIEGLTTNPALRTVLCYSWLDHGTPPKDSPFLASLKLSDLVTICVNWSHGHNNQVHALMHRHFAKSGTYFPVNGASEIPLSIIPTIERMGGRVLVKADVKDIMMENVSLLYSEYQLLFYRQKLI